ncbi:ROK family transcriptional regulator [Longispora sp. NPDC051575]|uniref:ROK family transcriptional regulator n=1 Tax=Longispora sp. NPDC051575 TaxID=3154943 RepID=UPI00341D9C5A
MARLAGSSRLLRAINESAALGHLLERGPLTRGDLRALTRLSKPTTSDVLRRLEEAGLAMIVGRTSGGPGPNADVYAANPNAAYAAAVSVRDTLSSATLPALSAAVCDLTGTLRARAELHIDPRATDPVDAVTDALAEVCRQAGITMRQLDHVQVAVPGSYDARTDTVHHIDVPGWSRPGLVGELRRRVLKVVDVDNDVNLAAVAERHRGVAAQPAGGPGPDATEGFALLWLGEGIGLAIDLAGTLLRGARQGAGEIGYMPIGMPGPDGRPDFHDLVGGTAVEALARQHGFGARTAPAAVALAVAAGTPQSAAFLAALAERIAVGLAAVVAVLDPPLVVLAGEVSQAGGEALRAAVESALNTAGPLRTPISSTGVTDDAALLGALDAALSAVREHLLSGLQF